MSVSQEDFQAIAWALMANVIRMLSIASERGMDIAEALRRDDLPTFSQVMGDMWKVAQPGCELHRVPIGDGSEGLPPEDVLKDLVLNYVTNADNKLMVAFIHGHQREGTDHLFDDFQVDEALRKRAVTILVERGYTHMDVTELLSALNFEDRLRGKIVKDIDAEVEAFREEMNAKLDSLFEGGGDST